MSPLEWILVLLEVIAIGYLGSILGKIIHAFIVKGMKFLSKRTTVTLDDILLQYIENPLRLSITVLSILLMSGLVPNLLVVQSAMMTYGVAILVILIAYTLSESVGAILRWYYEISKTRQTQFLDLTLLPFIRKVTRIVFITVGGIIALSLIGVDVSGLLAITSVGVLILGLASQESLANIFAGLVLQLDRPASYGDYVRTLNGDILRLQKIGSRSAKFHDLDGNLVVMSNSELAKQRLTNLSNLRTGFHTNIQADIPAKIPPGKIDEILSQFFKNESTKMSSTRASPSLVEKIAKDGYSISIPIAVKDAEDFLSIRNRINRAILHEIAGHSTHPQETKKKAD
ncbi:MAG: mechanosensitive ion channel family protein [Candidatus Iainarchaeum archaeon]|uniref:Mechanosensitive ion channel family protein n=1 Tax=Candidatus Iainarchaeum sp. TaxID=3101447 RepID=A0A7T9I2I0_9ARCH|nr:MAG: mechanosensitive ion channel family protein [Candidatus Diapherotrites archaeon]